MYIHIYPLKCPLGLVKSHKMSLNKVLSHIVSFDIAFHDYRYSQFKGSRRASIC